MAGEMWWLRDSWSKLSYLQNEPRVGDYIDGRLAEDKKSFWFALQRIQKSPPYTEPNGFINADMNDCSGWMLSAEHSDGYPGGDEGIECESDLAPFAPIRFMAHTSSWKAVMRDIPADYFALGFGARSRDIPDSTRLLSMTRSMHLCAQPTGKTSIQSLLQAAGIPLKSPSSRSSIS